MPEENARIELPGYGLPLTPKETEDGDDRSRYLSAVLDCSIITDKPDWTRKVFDLDIVAKWKEEALGMDWTKAGIEGGDMTEDMFANCIKELRDKALFYDKHGFAPVLDISATVVKSDSILTSELTNALKAAVRPLEDVPEKHKDWHPGSGGKVLDLVHPSLFPLVYGRSRILPSGTVSIEDCINKIGEGEIIPVPYIDDEDLKRNSRHRNRGGIDLWSTRFQWLPCDVTFPDGENAKIVSYFNNLHPEKHQDLYEVLEELITRSVPLWNVTTQFIGVTQGNRAWTENIESRSPEGSPPPGPEGLEGVDLEDWQWEWRYENRTTIKPDALGYSGLHYEGEVVEDKFAFLGGKEKKIQVIAKLANIHLTPEKPEYQGGSWHVEGQLNEHIVGTALYYYDNSNITDSRLAFRTRVDTGDDCFYSYVGYEQNDHDGIRTVFGFPGGPGSEQAIQEIGSVLTREGRVVAFPNGFQHRVGPFRLQDPSKPGHRKIVALFLVDPDIEIISTANVPPQQRDWWLEAIGHKRDGALTGRLPAELVDMVGAIVDDFPIGLEEAKKIREELMDERGRLDENVDALYSNDMFNFCEH